MDIVENISESRACHKCDVLICKKCFENLDQENCPKCNAPYFNLEFNAREANLGERDYPMFLKYTCS